LKRLKIYLETTVWNFLIADDAPGKREITKQLFSEMGHAKYDIFISDFVVDEIQNAPEPRKSRLQELISNYRPEKLVINDDSELLARQYMEKCIVPEKFEMDLFHIAIAVVHNMDVVLSWNMKHIVNYRTKLGVNSINLAEGYKSIELLTPEEVIEDD